MPTFESRIPDRISFAEALQRVCASSHPLPPIPTHILECEGRAAGEEVRSPLTLPPGPTSHMDGYALRSAELIQSIEGEEGALDSNAFPVIGRSLPGEPWTAPLPSGTAIRIMTGALLPPEADTVVPVEETDREEGEDGVIRIPLAALPSATTPLEGRYVRPTGEEAHEGEVLAFPGDTLDFRLLAHLYASGIEGLLTHPHPRVALIVTGSELVPAGNRAALAGGVRRADILSPVLASLIRHAGGVVSASLRASDDRESLRSAFHEAARGADLIITTGGASVGEADLVKAVLLEVGGELDFWRIRMRPGSPVSLGRLPRDDRPPLPVLGLPGNPVSAVVAFALLGGPALRSLGGHARIFPRILRARVRAPLPGPKPLARFPRVRLVSEGVGEWGAYLAAEEGSGVIRGITRGDGVAFLAEGEPSPEIGESVSVIPFPGSEWVEATL